MRHSLVLALLLSCASAEAADIDQAKAASTLTLHWQDRFVEVIGPQIPGGSIRTHYLEAYLLSSRVDRT